MIGICDYGSGNVQAISNIYTRLNIAHCFISTTDQFTSDLSKLILPGVGAFDETMALLAQSNLIPALTDFVFSRHVPVLGICVGMQIMAKSSEEGSLLGLNWIPGRVKLFDKSVLKTKPTTPHLGWNSVKFSRQSPLFSHIDSTEGFYFIHSYYYECENASDVLTTTNYGIEFASAICRGNIFGTQFHPEKSHSNGVQTLKNFAELETC